MAVGYTLSSLDTNISTATGHGTLPSVIHHHGFAGPEYGDEHQGREFVPRARPPGTRDEHRGLFKTACWRDGFHSHGKAQVHPTAGIQKKHWADDVHGTLEDAPIATAGANQLNATTINCFRLYAPSSQASIVDSEG